MPRHILANLRSDCKQSDATFQLQTAAGQPVYEGILPVTIGELPSGRLQVSLRASLDIRRNDALTVKADSTTTARIDFQYGKITFETTPSGGGGRIGTKNSGGKRR